MVKRRTTKRWAYDTERKSYCKSVPIYIHKKQSYPNTHKIGRQIESYCKTKMPFDKQYATKIRKAITVKKNV